MKKQTAGTILIISLLLLSCQSPKKESTPPLAATPTLSSPKNTVSTVRLKPTKELILENGLKVFVFRDMSLPRFSINLLVKVGQAADAIDKVGVNYLTASLLEKGTNLYSATQIADKIASLGSDLSIAPGEEFTLISIDGLSMSIDPIVDIFGELVFKPTFQNEEIVKLKKDFSAQLKKIQDEPSQLASLGIQNLVYRGTSLAYPVIGTEASLKKITKSDVIKNYLTFYRPNNSILSIVGSINEEVERKIIERFKQWPSRPMKSSPIAVKASTDNKNFEVNFKRELVQSEIRLSMPLVPRKHPDYLKLRLVNEILGGGFVSRLNSKIRDQLGLTYGISSSLNLGFDEGFLSISTFTKNETTVQVLEQIKIEVEKLIAEGVTAKELSSAKNMVLAQFPRALETVDRIGFNFMYLDFYGVSPNYLYDFQRNIDRITLDELNQAIKNHLNSAKIKTFVLANPNLDKALKIFQ